MLLQITKAKRLCIGSVHGTFSIELINVLSWCTVIKTRAAIVVPDENPDAEDAGPNYNQVCGYN